MGYMNHHAIIVTSYDIDRLKPVHAKAKEIFLSCSEIVYSRINGYVSFFIAPDGSKEGWRDSHEGDSRREEFKVWLTSSGSMVEAVEIMYGGDEPELKSIDIIGE